MKDYQEVILQLKSPKGKYWMWDISGQLCTKMCMITIDLVMHAKE
jgi:hypothetical protein